MTDKELRRLGRSELIDIVYELEKRNEESGQEVARLQAQLQDRTLRLSQAGSIAEAALQINGVMEAAQAAADQYVQAAEADRQQAGTELSDARSQAESIVSDAQAQAEGILADARTQAEGIVSEAQERARSIDDQVQEKWDQFQERAQRLIAAHQELSALLGGKDPS